MYIYDLVYLKCIYVISLSKGLKIKNNKDIILFQGNEAK